MKKHLFYLWLSIILSLLIVQTTAFSQEILADQVGAAIANHFYGNFKVTSNMKGSVTIKGEVNSLYEKYKIFEIASKVPGVKAISNQVTINTATLPDKEIEANIKEEMIYVSSIWEPDRIKVSVDNGVVFLEGQVSFYHEKLMMETMSSWQKGVKGIVNRLEVLPPQKAKNDENLKEVLNEIMEHEFSREHNINFTIEKGIVFLNGSASTLWAKHHVEETFLNVIGIKDVKDNLVIKPIA
jgi:osmotically-inducible protein OsmY